MTLHTTTAAVDAYVSRGFSVIPLRRRDKRPAGAWKDAQARRADTLALQQIIQSAGGCNVGIVTGAVSGVVVVDLDSSEAVAWAIATLPSTPMRTRTAAGEHWFYRHPGGSIRNRQHARPGVDVRGDGGYVVAAPSLHPTGVLYEAMGNWPESVDMLPVYDPAWLEEVR